LFFSSVSGSPPKPLAPAAFDYPKTLIVPLAKWISAFMKWLVNEATFGLFSFTELTRFVSAVLDIPYTLALSLLSTGFLEGSGSSAVQILPPLPWVAVIGLVPCSVIGSVEPAWRCSPAVVSCSWPYSGNGTVPW
jgi:hypothetical protein